MVSVLKSHGHSEPELYNIGLLIVETRLIEDHLNRQLATEAILTQAAIASVLSKEGGKMFKKLIERLSDA